MTGPLAPATSEGRINLLPATIRINQTMLQLINEPFIQALLFFGVAVLYSSVGLAGGPAYIALLAVFDVHYKAIPLITLGLNMLVSAVGTFNYFRYKHGRIRLVLPFVTSAVPFSFLGGSLAIPPELFNLVVFVFLFLIILKIYFYRDPGLRLHLPAGQKYASAFSAGAVLGLVCGISGLGGGIFLIPLILLLGLGDEKEAAACASLFIFLASVSGLIARFRYQFIDVSGYWPIVGAVLAGGWLGSYLGSTRLKPRTMEKILGGIIVIALTVLVVKEL